MSQIMRKWIGDRQVDSTKIDPTDTYTMASLGLGPNTMATSTDPLYVKTGPVSALRLESTTTGKAYRLTSDSAGAFNIYDITDSTNRLSISPTGAVSIASAVIETIAGDASILGNLYVAEDASFATSGGTGIRVWGNNVNNNVVQATSGLLTLEVGAQAIQLDDDAGTVTIETPALSVWGDTTVTNNLSVGESLHVGNGAPTDEVAIITGNGEVDIYGGGSYPVIQAVSDTALGLSGSGGNPVVCQNDFNVSGDTTVTNNLSIGGNVSASALHTGSNEVSSSGVNFNTDVHANADLYAGQDFYLTNSAHITDATTGHLYVSGDAVTTGNITSTSGSISALHELLGQFVYARGGDVSASGNLYGSDIYMNGLHGDTTNAVIGGRTFQFTSGVLTAIY